MNVSDQLNSKIGCSTEDLDKEEEEGEMEASIERKEEREMDASMERKRGNRDGSIRGKKKRKERWKHL